MHTPVTRAGCDHAQHPLMCHFKTQAAAAAPWSCSSARAHSSVAPAMLHLGRMLISGHPALRTPSSSRTPSLSRPTTSATKSREQLLWVVGGGCSIHRTPAGHHDALTSLSLCIWYPAPGGISLTTLHTAAGTPLYPADLPASASEHGRANPRPSWSVMEGSTFCHN